jgi:hypothetical protein
MRELDLSRETIQSQGENIPKPLVVPWSPFLNVSSNNGQPSASTT